jgi:hypothetical protein
MEPPNLAIDFYGTTRTVHFVQGTGFSSKRLLVQEASRPRGFSSKRLLVQEASRPRGFSSKRLLVQGTGFSSKGTGFSSKGTGFSSKGQASRPRDRLLGDLNGNIDRQGEIPTRKG